MHVLGMVCVRVRARVSAGMGRCARPCVLKKKQIKNYKTERLAGYRE